MCGLRPASDKTPWDRKLLHFDVHLITYLLVGATTPKSLGAKAADEATKRANRRQKVFMVDVFWKLSVVMMVAAKFKVSHEQSQNPTGINFASTEHRSIVHGSTRLSHQWKLKYVMEPKSAGPSQPRKIVE
jgi:hypothetical protein